MNPSKRRISFFSLFLILYLQLTVLYGQPDEIQLLERDFPNLMRLFGDKLSQTHADFVIAVDVSRSMEPFWSDIQHGLEIFVSAIPDSDYLSIIFFGETARLPYPPTLITPDVRSEIIATLRRTQPTDNRTDLGYMLNKILKELNRPGGNDLKFVFIFTDFWHVLAKNSPYQRSDNTVWENLRIRFENEQLGRTIESFALLLPLSRRVGKDLHLVRNVFRNMNEIRLNRTTLRQWFQRRRAEILRDRLRYLVQKKIKKSKPEVIPTLSKNKTIVLKINQKEDYLTESIIVQSVVLDRVAEKEAIQWQIVKHFTPLKKKEKEIVLAYGRCEKKPFFPQYIFQKLPIQVQLKQRFRYPQELRRLNLIDNRDLSVNTVITGNLKCEIIPLWVSVFILSFFIFIIGCVIWSCIRPVRINGRITVFIPNGLPINKTILDEKGIQIGKVDNSFQGYLIELPNVDWCWEMQIRKNCPCFFLKKAGVYGKLKSGISARVRNPGKSDPTIVSQEESIYLDRGCTIEISHLNKNYKIIWQ